MKKIRLILDIEVDTNPDESVEKSIEEIAKAVEVYSDDVVDGFVVTTNFPECDNTNDFFLKDFSLVSAEVIEE